MFQTTKEGVIISLFIQPNAPKNQIIGEYNGALKIKIKAPPVDGKANAEIEKFVSKTLEISKSSVEILKGEKSKLKRLLVRGLSEAEIREKLLG